MTVRTRFVAPAVALPARGVQLAAAVRERIS